MARFTRYTGSVDWKNAYRRHGYGDNARFERVDKNDWTNEGDGGRSFDVWFSNPRSTAPPDEPAAPAKKSSKPKSAVTPPAPEPEPEPAPPAVTADERAEVTQPAAGLESTTDNTPPKKTLNPYDLPKQAPANVTRPGLGAAPQSFLTKKKKELESFLTRSA